MEKISFNFIIACSLIYIEVTTGVLQYVNDEARLHADIFQKRPHNKDVRPVAKQSDNIEVKFGLSLQSIDGLDLEQNMLHTHCWLNYDWKDLQFVWNESDYGGTRSIRVNVDDIWVPDICPYNAQRFDFDILTEQTSVVYSNGKISWVPPVLLSTTCSVDLWKYPYDQQVCVIKFGSWTYDGTKINLTSQRDYVDISTYMPNPTYDLLNYTATRHVIRYDCCPESYIDITYALQLKRRSTYTSHLYISPAIVIALLLPVIFILPPESKEKLTLGVGLLITDAIVFMALIDGLPIMGNMNMPLIGVYHIINMVLISLSLIISAFVINIWNKGERARLLPRWINTVILVPLGKVLCISKQDIVQQESGTDLQRLQEKESDDVHVISGVQNANMTEWRQLAIIIDRLFFLIFLAVVIVCVIVFGSM